MRYFSFVLLLLLNCMSLSAQAQTPQYTSSHKALQRNVTVRINATAADSAMFDLLSKKIDYEKYKADVFYSGLHVQQRDSSYKAYLNQIEYVKSKSAICLARINELLADSSLYNDKAYRLYYSYISGLSSGNHGVHLITLFDYYKLLKKELFENNALVLPPYTEAYIQNGGDAAKFTLQ